MSIAFAETDIEHAPISGSDASHVVTIVKAITRVADAWKLTNIEAAGLMDVPTATWSRMKAGSFKGKLDQDKMTRASLIIGLYKGLRLLFNGPLTFGWPKLPNKGPGYDGSTPIQLMRRGGIPSMIAVRQHIDALRGGL